MVQQPPRIVSYCLLWCDGMVPTVTFVDPQRLKVHESALPLLKQESQDLWSMVSLLLTSVEADAPALGVFAVSADDSLLPTTTGAHTTCPVPSTTEKCTRSNCPQGKSKIGN